MQLTQTARGNLFELGLATTSLLGAGLYKMLYLLGHPAQLSLQDFIFLPETVNCSCLLHVPSKNQVQLLMQCYMGVGK